MNPDAALIGRWQRLQRFAASMGLYLAVDMDEEVFTITEGNAQGKEVATRLPTLAGVQRILMMYHRIETRYALPPQPHPTVGDSLESAYG